MLDRLDQLLEELHLNSLGDLPPSRTRLGAPKAITPASPSLLRHRQTKVQDSARPHLNCRATPRLQLRTPVSERYRDLDEAAAAADAIACSGAAVCVG